MIRDIIAALLELKWKILAIGAVIVVLRCMWLWQPARQVELHQQHFLKAVEDRDWGKFNAFLDEGFRTPNGHDKKWVLSEANEVLRQFISMKITASDTAVTVQDTTGSVRELLHVEGNGMGYAEMAKQAVNESHDPWEFTWKHRSWKPWDWALVTVDHPLLRRTSEE